MEKHLNNINQNANYREWRNHVNTLTHMAEGSIHNSTVLNITGSVPSGREANYPNQTEIQMEYRFMADSFSGEFGKLLIPTSRPFDEINLIVILG